MPALLFVLLIADGFILLLSYAQFREAWADEACYYLTPLCGYPNWLIIVAIILVGLYFAMRA